MTKLKARIPFQGFYNSIHDDNFDQYLMLEANDDHEVVNTMIDLIDWQTSHINYAKKFVDLINSEFNLTLEYRSLYSPKEYNFHTDEVYTDIELSELQAIFDKTDKEKLNDVIKSLFTSYDGFISFYPNKLDLFPSDLSEWDEIHIFTLLTCYFDQEYQFDDWESSLVENYYEICSNCIAFTDGIAEQKFTDLINLVRENE